MNNYYVVEGEHVDPNDKKSLIESSKKIHGPYNEEEANKYARSLIAKNILFICGGAFDGIDKVIARRINTNAIGFSVNKDEQENARKNLLQFINAQDLKSFGLIPELLGRLPVVTHLEPLDAGILRSILTEPKNSLLKQYHRLFELEGIELIIEEEVLDFMVGKAMEYKLGARGLRSICESILTDAMFELPGTDTQKFIVTLDYAEQKFSKSKLSSLKVA